MTHIMDIPKEISREHWSIIIDTIKKLKQFDENDEDDQVLAGAFEHFIPEDQKMLGILGYKTHLLMANMEFTLMCEKEREE